MPLLQTAPIWQRSTNAAHAFKELVLRDAVGHGHEYLHWEGHKRWGITARMEVASHITL